MTAYAQLNHPEVRVDGNYVVPFNDLIGLIPAEVSAGMDLQVRVPRSGLRGLGRVFEIDYYARQLTIDVEWINVEVKA
ncbi:hypothetical protein SEA_LOZINAK_93 [Gordonia phage Lozinak]|uniref:Uncharacterized protein n=3 Tax=Smoothievirus TaxID=1982557 RepID=A0A2D1GFT9_9CAUD|nr:hypothetical protein BEN60_gp113 [Gordonia phage Smoothie]YP_009276206.1 hypothetical protein BH772_gp116 [Gordonia phage Bachita]YP_009281248.1 hypothetical protein BIZ74_gp111 [Gordonia phage Cucurbita]ATN90719.1 hypothetical protein SEA_LOZINAK_93 [Gordonia phage Lozinak]QKY79670.1 hypothetical protein SEA_ENGINEER_94 [Gordonia Phage Engineer]WKW85891.1 hypothetical protein SEA_PHINKBODEN_92 [Gordonia Phage PhinkBoden]ANA86250.1 hypothetical protein PBI_SMOOTHIE_94 [Gordonia phage Smoot